MYRFSGSLWLAALLLSPIAALAGRAPSELVWQDRFDIGGHRDGLNNVVVADGIVVVDGLSWLDKLPGRDRRERATHVSAYDLATGELLWRQQFRAKGGRDLFVHDGTVILTGFSHFRIRAFDLATGEPVWGSVERDLEAELQTNTLVDGVLYTGGYWRPGDAPIFDLLVQARDASSGELLWEERAPGLPLGRWAAVSALAVQNGLLAVLSAERGERNTGVITAFDAATGQRLWRRTTDNTDLRQIDSDAALCRGLLFVSGTRSDAPFGSPHTFVVRALDTRTGESVWEREFTERKKTSYSSAGLECAGPRIFASALSDDPNDGKDAKLFLWAFDFRRGAVRWQHEFQGDRIFGRIEQLERGSVFFRVDNLLQAYSRRQGRLIWETDPHPEGGWTEVDLADGGRLAVAAGIFTDATRGDAVVRVLE